LKVTYWDLLLLEEEEEEEFIYHK